VCSGEFDALVERLVAGDDEALEELFDRYAGFVIGVAGRVTGDSPRAEDVLQEVIAAVWTHPERYGAGRGALQAGLGVLAHRRAADLVGVGTCRSADPPGDGSVAAAAPGKASSANQKPSPTGRTVLEITP
jgi:DNA-directed RNA polymerase specialized sigma24 family protein